MGSTSKMAWSLIEILTTLLNSFDVFDEPPAWRTRLSFLNNIAKYLPSIFQLHPQENDHQLVRD
jgi:hypothetical protein